MEFCLNLVGCSEFCVFGMRNWIELFVCVVGVALESSWLRYKGYFTLSYENCQDVSRKKNMQSVFMGVCEERVADVKCLAKKKKKEARFTEIQFYWSKKKLTDLENGNNT